MRSWLIALAAALMAVTAAPASAASKIDCVNEQLTDAQRDAIYADFLADRDVGADIDSLILGCAQQNDWSSAALEQAVRYTLALTLRRGMLRDARQPVAAIEAAEADVLRSLSEAEGRRIVRENADMSDNPSFARAMRTAGLSDTAEMRNTLAGTVLMSLTIRYARLDFSAR